MNEIIAATSREHASENTKYYALYNYFIRRHTKSAVALTFNKSISTITAWIDRYAETGTVARIQRSSWPENQNAPDLFYNENEARKYNSSSRMVNIQAEISSRAIELLNLPADRPSYVLDIGCGSMDVKNQKYFLFWFLVFGFLVFTFGLVFIRF